MRGQMSINRTSQATPCYRARANRFAATAEGVRDCQVREDALERAGAVRLVDCFKRWRRCAIGSASRGFEQQYQQRSTRVQRRLMFRCTRFAIP